MIKASELRIGNIYRDRLTGRILVVDSLSKEKIIFDQHGGPLPNGWQAEPVLLTEEWLQKCGFELHGGVHYLDYDENQLQFRVGDDQLGILPPDGCTGGHTIYFPCKYIHHLQNLYFILTGQELSINQSTYDTDNNNQAEGM